MMEWAWHSPKTLPTMLYTQAFCIITWNLLIGTISILFQLQSKISAQVVPFLLHFCIVFFKLLNCSHHEYSWNICHRTLNNKQSINRFNTRPTQWVGFITIHIYISLQSGHIIQSFMEYNFCPVWSRVLIVTHCPIQLIYLW
jgi:hypothetical protein